MVDDQPAWADWVVIGALDGTVQSRTYADGWIDAVGLANVAAFKGMDSISIHKVVKSTTE